MNRGNWIMLILLVGLATFYYVHDIKGKPEKEKAEKQAKRFFPDIEKSDVAGVKVERLKPAPGATPFVHDMVKDNGVWVLQGSEPKVLRTGSLGSTVKSLVELERADDMNSEGSKPIPADFGLDKPSFKVTIRDKKGQERSLLLGDKTPDEQGYYATLGEGQTISAVNSTLPDLLEGNVDNIRETSPVVFESSTANKVVIESASGPPIEVALAKPREDSGDDDTDDGMEITDLNEEWKILKPEAAEADGNKVRDLLNSWKNVQFGRFLKASEKVDFGSPTVKLTISVDRQSKPFVIEVGSAVPGKPGLYYARRSPPGETMVLEIKDFKMLEPKLAHVLQQHLYVFQPEQVTRLEATVEGTKISATKSGDKWKVSDPKAPAGSDEESRGLAANDLVWELKNLEWKDKADPATLPKEWKERASIEVFDKDKKSLGKVSLGSLGPQAVGAFVRDAKGNTYVLDKDPFSRWQDIKLRLEGKAPKALTPTPQPSATP